MAHAALKSDGLTVHVLEVGPTELDHDTADLGLDIAIVARRRHVDVGFKGIGVRGLEILELGGPGKRAHDIGVHAILAPTRWPRHG